ncbi:MULTISPECIES: ATP-dependent DNA helicase [unclassified Frankia]|uniref:ATP-dependent helicase n=1 Tax=unclassified Frankia TaxID=2632575 RepID=UPI001EF4A892|nr:MULTISPECIES: ATP-dependent DNA helicase [unclassified Frankia]
MAGPPVYRLVRTPPPPSRPPVLDTDQARVVAHTGGPLLVLAGPGTGKTTTIVEAVVRRVEDGLDPQRILVLTFSRRAAQELRERITRRLRAAVGAPLAWTFHAWCYAVLRLGRPAGLGGAPPRLLSGPEQDTKLRDLLAGTVEVGRPRWPAALAGCLTSRGFAEEVRAMLARARETGLSPDALAALARRTGRDDWAAMATFYADYLDALDLEGMIDYSELVQQAAAVAEDDDVGVGLRRRYRAVFVDEYQDTDPAQERLLRAVAGGGADLVAVGDPDQSIYGFRGAEVRGLLEFPTRFPHADGRPAEVVALRRCRRLGPVALAVSRRVADRIPATGLPAEHLRAHRDLIAAGGPDKPGTERVEARLYTSEGAQAEGVADLLRREHLENGTPWDRMAVLVRSAARSVPPLRRMLTAAGVPVEVGGDELPLARDGAVAPLLLALRCVDNPDRELTAETVRILLTGPLGGADPTTLRALGRALRAIDRAASVPGATAPAVPSPSAELIRLAVADPGRALPMVPDHVAGPARRLGELLRSARALLKRGGAPEDVAWLLWSGTSWPARLERASAAGGAAGRAADRDLDAVVALFATIGRSSARRGPGTGIGPLLDELEQQQVTGDTLAERPARGGVVRLLTAHRGKGLEWDVVVVCGVQDGQWPDLRTRHSLLESERLDRPELGGMREPATRAELLADERRLFYVALTRARRRLVVTAVDAADDQGVSPSRFFRELCDAAPLGVSVTTQRSRLARPLTLSSAVAALRRAAVDPASTPALREAAAARLARLASAVDDAGRPLVASARPGRWWGLAEVTAGEVPVVAVGAPIRLSGSSLSGLSTCPMRWFLEHEAHAQAASNSDMGFGKVVHALADEVATGRTAPDLDALDARLDRVWRHLAYEAPWRSEQQRAAARQALARFLRWHTATRNRRLVASEVPFSCDIVVGGRTVKLRGFIDRIELDDDGRVHVVDFKTGRTAPSSSDVARHPQLGIYQVAVRDGAVASTADGARAEPGGAELVHLRLDAPSAPAQPPAPAGPAGEAAGHPPARAPKVQRQDALPVDGPTWVEELLSEAVEHIDAERFPPRPGTACPTCAFRRCCPAQDEGQQVIT